ncbi:hypothetical protein AVEN_180102-1 [Araneus ventricosus]|uniref:Uncharacterized protein n=1 Tax=Araneus ventricosus TaxID=182803 RepID=A0A4Y2NA87_ARAVE|nr:hypothetical protein AVEN_180102-1 [Araneus ventricosus]
MQYVSAGEQLSSSSFWRWAVQNIPTMDVEVGIRMGNFPQTLFSFPSFFLSSSCCAAYNSLPLVKVQVGPDLETRRVQLREWNWRDAS